MSMESDVKSATITGTGVVVNRRSRLRGIFMHTAGSNGTLTIEDDALGAVITLTTKSNEQTYMLLPGRGILCTKNMNCTAFSNMTSVTLFYEG